jgi:hypothetical protein
MERGHATTGHQPPGHTPNQPTMIPDPQLF